MIILRITETGLPLVSRELENKILGKPEGGQNWPKNHFRVNIKNARKTSFGQFYDFIPLI